MQDGDKNLLKQSGMVVLDQAASSVPGLNIAWGLTKALLGNGLQLRQQRALEWVELVRDNPEVFTEEIMATEQFQDSFVYCIEQYIAERNEEKRQYIKSVFMGFVAVGDHEEFPLERLLMTSQQLSNIDVATLKDVDPERQDRNYQIYGTTDQRVDNIYNLIHLGLLSEFSDSRIREAGFPAPFVRITAFGKEFVSYVTE